MEVDDILASLVAQHEKKTLMPYENTAKAQISQSMRAVWLEHLLQYSLIIESGSKDPGQTPRMRILTSRNMPI